MVRVMTDIGAVMPAAFAFGMRARRHFRDRIKIIASIRSLVKSGAGSDKHKPKIVTQTFHHFISRAGCVEIKFRLE